MKKVRIGCGAGCCQDRIEPVVEMIENGNIDYLVYETLAEASYLDLHVKKRSNITDGYNDMLIERMERTLKPAHDKNIKIITNMGGANALKAAEAVAEVARRLGIEGLKIGVVTGDDLMPNIDCYLDNERWQYPGKTLRPLKDGIIFANAYLGGDAICEALRQEADVVITGRVADPALFTGPLMYEFGWGHEDLDKMGQSVLLGHLLECAGQLTGGLYADPGYKEVEDLDAIGFPIAEMSECGEFVVTKTPGSGGVVCVDNCREQLLYEIFDPYNYKTPDGVVSFGNVHLEQIGKDKVRITGAVSKGLPETFKVNVGYRDGYIAAGFACYAGANALKLAQLCADMIQKRMRRNGVEPDNIRVDYMGYGAMSGVKIAKETNAAKPSEIFLRIAIRTHDARVARLFTREFSFLYTNGPAGSTGVRSSIDEVYGVTSIFVPGTDIFPEVTMMEA